MDLKPVGDLPSDAKIDILTYDYSRCLVMAAGFVLPIHFIGLHVLNALRTPKYISFMVVGAIFATIGGKDITTVPPRRRGFGMVFQDYSLFPHLTARANIAYGLRVRRTDATTITRTVDELLEVTRLDRKSTRLNSSHT